MYFATKAITYFKNQIQFIKMSRETFRSHQDLEVYKKAFEVAMRIFELSKKFPVEERYSLTDQIRRSSRSVCANLAEAWRKR